MSQDQRISNQAPASSEFFDLTAPSQSKKKKYSPRKLLDEEHLCMLIAAYNVYFEKYSAVRTQVTQLIPSKVWKATYAHYKHKYPLSTFKQDTLKERLRESLKELKTSNFNKENAERAALQCNKVMAELGCTDGDAKSNVLRKRQKILSATKVVDINSEGNDESEPRQATTRPSASPVDGRGLPKTHMEVRKQLEAVKENHSMTITQMLYKQSTSIENFCKAYERSTTKRHALVNLKLNQNCEKQKKHRLTNLKTALTYGVITESEFKVCVKELLDIKT